MAFLWGLPALAQGLSGGSPPRGKTLLEEKSRA